MKITEVKISLIENDRNNVVAYASIVFDASFAIRHIRIVETARGKMVCMPNRKRNNGGAEFYEDVAFPINKFFREYVDDEILREYERFKISPRSAPISAEHSPKPAAASRSAAGR